MSMTATTVRSLLLILVMSTLVGCASTGTIPRPQPFPGARVPDASTGNPVEVPPPTVSPAPTGLVETALGLRGTPYANGGSTPATGFDCSGFVQWVFAQYHTTLPREVRDQYDQGRRIGQDDVQPGDLVFFETVSRGPSHVGIALGGGEFVHAPSSRGVVRVERYTSGYWSSRWLGARRITLAE